MTLIELDLSEPQEPALSAPPPAHVYRVPGLLLALVLLLAAGAAAGPPPPAYWRRLGDVALGPNDTFTLAGDQLYTTSGAGTARKIVAYSAGSKPQKLWTLDFPYAPNRDSGYVSRGITAYRTGAQVIIGDGGGWIVADAATGTMRWRPASGFTVLTGFGTGTSTGIGFTVHSRFRPGTEYNVDSGDPGPLFFDENAVPHTEAPQVTEVSGVSVADGHKLWTYEAPGSINALPARGADPAVLVLSSRAVARIDGRTGKIAKRADLKPIGKLDPTYGKSVSGALLVDYFDMSGGDYEGAGYEVAYDPVTLAERWRRPQTQENLSANCMNILCGGARGRITVVLDAGTGQPSWQVNAATAIMPAGPYVLEFDNRTNQPLRLADPVTGQVRLDLRAWATGMIPVVDNDDAVLVKRDLGADGAVFGAVLSEQNELRPLGASADRVGDCTAAHGVIACRVPDGLRLWYYRV